MRLQRTLQLVMTIAIATLFVSNLRAETAEEKALREAYAQASEEILELGRNQRDKAGLMQKADEISEYWPSRNMQYYGELMNDICRKLYNDCEVDYKIPREEIREVAWRALQTYDPNKADNISIESHYRLVSSIQGQYMYTEESTKGEMSDNDWAAKRRGEVESWMVVWDRMEAAIAPDWDPNDLPMINVSPPDGVSGNSGMSPDAIKDPALREEYKQAIEANNRKSKYYGEQYELRKLKKRFSESLVSYFTGTYSIAPYNDEELEAFLTAHIKEEETRVAIRDGVAEKRAFLEEQQRILSQIEKPLTNLHLTNP